MPSILRLRSVLAAALLTLLAAEARGAMFDMGPEFGSVTTQVRTPHIAWARPLAGEPLRVLVIAPRFAHRETAELMQRLDARCDVVMFRSPKQIGAACSIVGWSEEERLADLRAKLEKPHDVIVVGNFCWDALPKPVQYEILKRVAAGAGLLLVLYGPGPPDVFPRLFQPEPVPELLRNGVPWAAAPSLRGAPPGAAGPLWSAGAARPQPKGRLIRLCGRLKRGRCLVLRWPVGPGGFHCLTAGPDDRIEYEYDLALVARALLWLAGRAPGAQVRIEPVGARPGRLRITARGAGAGDALELAVRDSSGEVEWRGVRKNAAETTEWRLPADLKAGRHFADAWLRAGPGGPVKAWASAFFDATNDAEIAGVKTDRESYAPGQRIAARVTFKRPIEKPLQVRVEAIDLCGRVWAAATARAEAGARDARVTFAARGMESCYNRLRVDAVRGGRVLSRAWGEAYAPLHRRPDFAFVAWGGGGRSWLSFIRYRCFHAAGLDAVIFSGDIRAGVRAVPYTTTHFRCGGKGDVRRPCLTDPAFWRRERARLERWPKQMKRADAFAYSLGDEICLDVSNTSVCRSLTCLAGFRQWLRKEYGSLERLNAEWGTRFARWEDVTPQSRREAQRAGNLAPWLDHRLFMDRVFADALARAREIIRRVDPSAPVGAEGLWGSASALGMDWTLLARRLDMLVPYWSRLLMRECIRSFQRPGMLTGTWFGDYGEKGVDDDYLRWVPWSALLHQFNSVWWYPEFRAVQFGDAATGWTPDFRPTHGLRAALESVRLIRSGVGPLLLRLRRENDGVAVLYSRSSVHVDGAEANPLLLAIEELGLQYDMIPAGALSPETLRAAGFKALVLPGACALSDADAAAIAAFVRAGGGLLAVGPPAVYDEHGRPRRESALADALGVKGLRAAREAAPARVRPLGSGAAFDAQCPQRFELAGASALAAFVDGRPAAALYSFGKGRAAFLGFSFKGFEDARRLWRSELPQRAFLGRVLAALGARPFPDVASPAPLRGYERVRFTDGRNEYLAILREPLGPAADRPQTAQRLRISWPERRWTCEVITRARLGETDRAETAMRPGDVRLFARLASPPRPPQLTARPARVAPGGEVVVAAPASPERLLVLHVEVAGPDGASLPWRTRNLVVGPRGARVAWRLALNAAPGAYQVSARDAVAGETASARFLVIPPSSLENKP